MKIKATAWHYWVYQYWAWLSPTYREGYRENLCHYVRVLLFWAPLLWARRTMRLQGLPRPSWMWLNAAILIGCVTMVFIVLGWLFVMIWLASVVGASLLAILLIVIAVALFGDRKPPEIPGTVKLAAAYVMARKHRVCPFIEFDAT